jgi:cyclohexanone monooxygenase
VESFKGHSFHTSRWDYAYTGGSSAGGLTGLADKRVGVIGTGATAVQCVPHLGQWAKSLHVFQRTPSSIDVRADRPTDPEWAKSLHPGWQRERVDNSTTVISGGAFDVDLVNDGWTDLIGGILLAARRAAAAGEAVDHPEALIELADHQKMERVRARVDEIVQDGATAAALKPWYNAFCKRPCFHDEYLQTFNRPSVTLVDTEGGGVERITEGAVWANGQEYKLDCLVYATGFEVGTGLAQRNGFEVVGRGGLTLTQKWAGGGGDLPWLLHPRLPQLLPDQRDTVGPERQLPAHAGCRRRPSRLRARQGQGRGRADDRAHRRGRGRLGGTSREGRSGPRLVPGGLHPRLLQPGGHGDGRPQDPEEQPVLARPERLHPHPEPLARRGRLARNGGDDPPASLTTRTFRAWRS